MCIQGEIPMHKTVLAGFVAASALVLAHQPANAQKVDDYTIFQNNTTVRWSLTQYTPESGGSVGLRGDTPISTKGGYSEGYFVDPVNTATSMTIVWQSDDGEVCTFRSTRQYDTYYKFWASTASGTRSGTGSHLCNAPVPSAGPSQGYTFNFWVSN